MPKPETKSKPTPANTPAPETAWPRIPVWLLAVLLALVTIALYWPAMRYDFVNYDDNLYVTENPHVQGGLNWVGVKWAFCNTEQAAYWAPLMWLSHMLDCQMYGLKPWGHHLTNVLLHALNAALVFLLLRQLCGATWRSLLVAALFAFHPMHVESVAWIAERKDVLSAFFGLLSLIFYVRYAQKRSSAERRASNAVTAVSALDSRLSSLDYCIALFFLALGLLSKPMLVTWPFIMLLLDFWPLGRLRISDFGFRTFRSLSSLLLEKIPFFTLAAVASCVTFVVQKKGGAVMALENLPLGARVGNALVSYCRYLGKLFWPTDLAVFYPHPGYWPLAEVLLAGLLLVAISVLFFVKRRQYPFLLMGWLWFCGMLVPVIQLVQSGGQAMADRFTYIPSLGVLILAVWGAYELFRRWRYHVIVLSLAGSAAIVLCLALTRQQLGDWQDSETLFRHAIAVTENNYLAHNNLGDALDRKGQADGAIREYQEAIRLKPGYADAHYNLGNALLKKGQTDEAIRQFQADIRLKPDDVDACYNLGTAFYKKGLMDEAIRQFQEVIRLKPDYAEAHYCLGMALGKKGQMDEAITQFQEAIRLKPDFAEAHNDLGIALDRKGQTGEAISQYQEYIRLKPDDADAHYNLGNALGRKGQTDEAMRQFQEALRLKPDSAETHNNLGIAFLSKSQVDEAISQFQEVVRLNPYNAEAHNNLGIALSNKNQTDEAIGQFQEAIRLDPNHVSARNNLGIALDRKDQTDEAISQYREAIRLKPDYADAHYNLGTALGRKGQMDEAISQFQEVIHLKSDNAEAYNKLGIALAAKGQFDEAIQNYRHAIEADPNRPESFYRLGLALGQLGRTREAIDSYQAALKLNPNLPAVLNNLAWALATSPDDGLRNGTEAVRLAERACELTHYAQPFFIGTLAAAYAEVGRFPEAVGMGEKAKQLATEAGAKGLAGQDQQLLELYRAGKPYHEPAPTGQK